MVPWLEIADRVFVRRYEFLDQTIGCVLGGDRVLLIDTRASLPQAEELKRDLRALTHLPVRDILNTHGHSDHVFGNAAFRPATIWSHAGCPAMLSRTADAQRAWLQATFPERAAELAAQTLDLPDRPFDERAAIDLGGRSVELRHPGRGHTDHDAIAIVSDASVVFAGDLVENGAAPAFEDAWPIDWPVTLRGLAGLEAMNAPGARVVPGHGPPADRKLVEAQAAILETVADVCRRVYDAELSVEEGVRLIPFDATMAAIALARGVRQLRGELTSETGS